MQVTGYEEKTEIPVSCILHPGSCHLNIMRILRYAAIYDENTWYNGSS